MHKSFLALLGALVFGLASAAPLAAGPPLCTVQAVSVPIDSLQRVVTITVRPGCPPGGVARLRLASALGGHLPDDPPGAYTLRPGQTLRRVMLRWWLVEWLSASGKPYTVPEERP